MCTQLCESVMPTLYKPISCVATIYNMHLVVLEHQARNYAMGIMLWKLHCPYQNIDRLLGWEVQITCDVQCQNLLIR